MLTVTTDHHPWGVRARCAGCPPTVPKRTNANGSVAPQLPEVCCLARRRGDDGRRRTRLRGEGRGGVRLDGKGRDGRRRAGWRGRGLGRLKRAGMETAGGMSRRGGNPAPPGRRPTRRSRGAPPRPADASRWRCCQRQRGPDTEVSKPRSPACPCGRVQAAVCLAPAASCSASQASTFERR